MNELWMIEAKEGKKTWMVFDNSAPFTSEDAAIDIASDWRLSALPRKIAYTPVKFVRATA
jgi:hypothetical protein